MAYFDANKLGDPKREFVLWLDCMGTQCFMQRSIKTAANFIFKFQNIIAKECSSFEKMRVYPVMDGVYITSPNSNDILSAATQILRELATVFIEESNVHFRFLVRGALAYGDIYHGDNIPKNAFKPKAQQEEVHIKKEAVLLGTPVIQAYQRESFAPPFGIAVHNSCKLDPKANPRFNYEWYAWCSIEDTALIDELKKAVDEYFNHFSQQTSYSGYSKDKIEAHRTAFNQFIYLCESRNAYH